MVMPINHTPEFQKVLRGYKVEEVDEFVSEISAGYEQQRRELFSAKEENDKLRKQLEYFQALEGSLNKALVAAQQKADEIINTAQDEVNRSLVESRERLENINTEIAQILAGATEKARQIEDEAYRRAEDIVIRVKEQVAGELSQQHEMGKRVERIRLELAQSLRVFLQEIEGTSKQGGWPENSAKAEPSNFTQVTETVVEPFKFTPATETVAEPFKSTPATETVAEPFKFTQANETVAEPFKFAPATETVAEPVKFTQTAEPVVEPLEFVQAATLAANVEAATAAETAAGAETTSATDPEETASTPSISTDSSIPW